MVGAVQHDCMVALAQGSGPDPGLGLSSVLGLSRNKDSSPCHGAACARQLAADPRFCLGPLGPS